MNMRPLACTITILLLGGSSLLAQTAPTKLEPLAVKTEASDEKLDGLLREWEAKMKKIERFMVNCKRVEIEALRGKTQTYSGEARYLKPNFASLDLANTEEKANRELMVSNGEKLYEFKLRDKLVVIHEMPKNGMAEESTFLSFLFGLKSDEVKKRYDLTLRKANDGEGYIYIDIVPKSNADKQEFSKAELVLYSQWISQIEPKDPARADWAFLPARLFFRQPNDNQSTWSFSNYDLKANLTKDSFLPPQWPKDWKTEVVKQGGNPPPALKEKEEIKPKNPSLVPSAPKSKLNTEK